MGNPTSHKFDAHTTLLQQKPRCRRGTRVRCRRLSRTLAAPLLASTVGLATVSVRMLRGQGQSIPLETNHPPMSILGTHAAQHAVAERKPVP